MLFALLWWVLTGGNAGSWLIGAPAVLAGVWLSRSTWTRQPPSFLRLAQFAPWFAFQSVAGAIDVAMRALQPALPLHPGLVRHRLRLPEGPSRVVLANVVSMLPGTLSADLDGDQLVIHALDRHQDPGAMVEDLEARIAAVFAVDLQSPQRPEAAR